MRDELGGYVAERLKDADFALAYDDEQRFLTLLETLSTRRSDLGLSQRAVAKLMGTTQSAVSELERAEADPRLSTLQRYARALGIQLVFHVDHNASQSRIEVSSQAATSSETTREWGCATDL